MNHNILALLAQYPVVLLEEAYTKKFLGNIEINKYGDVKGIVSKQPITTLNLSDIAEVRFRANEPPTIYYETVYSKLVINPKKSKTSTTLKG